MLVSHKKACDILGCSAPTLRKYLREVGYMPQTLQVPTSRGVRYAQGITGTTLDQVRALLYPARPQGPGRGLEDLEARLVRLEAQLGSTGRVEASEGSNLVTMMELVEITGANPYQVRASLAYYGSRFAQEYRREYGREPSQRVGGAHAANLYPVEPRMLKIARAILG